ncbi:MAG: 50S ribosomal protein L21 [Candidatus Marinimicrobia bacterium]|jgi:large subunit ribosomal protein L21|nr:50S ribosomal protein L21 [Candidatus Neomarinimicrobiota bacterium]MBT3501224.1 50S ribosomal protein L21 [Candidatus Neomarinimicrobiota bacterium]MBT3839505.1 50S ribosomal protein L21 [Candidatus Neomarinimicrobiota bacterium]MBT3999406.1 50S ribosomal protein L21 [Candidatus Neomarinimicrobiota bacterium]MBT4282510.1 50S ribosomal protein L21 [Candidatus Neomarinimicrobiota bacterium]
MYAIVNISGKQFKAIEGARVRVPLQVGDAGTKLTFESVLLVHDGTDTKIGTPTVSGATVTATVLDHGREKKILIYKKKRRKGYQRKNGHRQWFTDVEIQKIQASATKTKKPAKKAAPKVKKAVKEEE